MIKYEIIAKECNDLFARTDKKYYKFSSYDGKTIEDVFQLFNDVNIPLGNWFYCSEFTDEDYEKFSELVQKVDEYFKNLEEERADVEMILGAITGDIVGSVYEFNNIKTKDFPLVNPTSRMTDDSIMTIAVAEIMKKGYINDKEKIIDTLKKWGRKYPNAGYGYRFYDWVLGDNRKPYYSCGNGSAMRVSPVAWYANSEEEVIDYARKVTEVTHNHPEGIKGAVVTAMCVYYARIGKSKEFIREYVEKFYDIDFDYEELRRTYTHEWEVCQVTVPQAIYCFLISNSFEDCLRTTISIGGDCDTTAAISCAIAEAYYGNPILIRNEIMRFLDDEMFEILDLENIKK